MDYIQHYPDRFHHPLVEFHTEQLDHLRREERTVFRDIKALDDAASAAILSRVDSLHDPLFKEVAYQQFDELIRELK